MKRFRKILSFKIWIPVLILGVFVALATPSLYMSKEAVRSGPHPPPAPDMGEMDKSTGPSAPMTTPVPAPTPINWTSLISQVCIGLGSLASVIRGVAELVKLIMPKRKEVQSEENYTR